MQPSRLFAALRNRLRNTSFRVKLLVIVMLISAMTLLFAGAFFYRHTAAFMQEDATKSFKMLMNQTQVSINNVFSGIEEASRSIVLNETLERILRRDSEGSYTLAMQIDDYYTMSKYIAMAAVNENINHVRLYFMNNAIYTHQKYRFFSIDDAQRKPWHERALFVEGAPIWSMDAGDIVCARAILRVDAPQDNYGFIEVVLTREKLESVIENVVTTTGGDVCILDDLGNTALTRGVDGELFAQRILASGMAHQANDSDAVPGVLAADERVVARRLSNHWVMYASLPYGPMRAQIRDFALQTLYICALALLLALAVAAISSAMLTRRIRHIADFMATVDIHSEDYSQEVQGDEMSIVAKSFNQLLRTAREALHNEKQALQRKRETDINILQEQINPHFLYNCLDSIHWLALDAGAKEISTMTMMLSRFYRLGLSKGSQIVSLADELEHARMYLEIMKMRFDGQIEDAFAIEVDPKRYATLKFILQPLIENAIVHGISGRLSQEGKIWIRCAIEEDIMILSVRDDGVGIPPEKWGILEETLRGSSPRSGFGLFNVSERLRLYFGEPYGLSIRNDYGRGVEVVARIPVDSRFAGLK